MDLHPPRSREFDYIHDSAPASRVMATDQQWARLFADMLAQVCAVADPAKYQTRIREVLADWDAFSATQSVPSPEADAEASP